MNRPSGEYKTVLVRSSFPAVTPTGATALVLVTDPEGPIAFVVDLEKIQIIRKNLNDIEAMLSQGIGNA